MGHPDHIRFGNCLQDPAMNPPTPLPSPINMLPHRPFATPVPTALIHTLEKNTKLAVGHPDQIRSGNRQPLPAIPPPWHTMLSHYLGGSFVFIVYFLLVWNCPFIGDIFFHFVSKGKIPLVLFWNIKNHSRLWLEMDFRTFDRNCHLRFDTTYRPPCFPATIWNSNVWLFWSGDMKIENDCFLFQLH